MTAPWHRARPTGAVDVATDDDEFLTIDKWPREVYRPHYHEEFNWVVPIRAGRMVARVEDEELTVDGDHWLCMFPRVPHAVVHVSDDSEFLSLFVPSSVMEAAWEALSPQPPLGRPVIVGGEPTIAHGLALAWGEQRMAKRRRDRFDDALATFLGGWLWRHYAAPSGDDLGVLGVKLRSAFGADGTAIAGFFERRLADQPFPWDALAAELGISTRTLQRRFTAATGHAPSGFLHRMRLERARDLLRDPARPIADVALAAGFASQAHFATAFRTAFGHSPSAYRKTFAA